MSDPREFLSVRVGHHHYSEFTPDGELPIAVGKRNLARGLAALADAAVLAGVANYGTPGESGAWFRGSDGRWVSLQSVTSVLGG